MTTTSEPPDNPRRYGGPNGYGHIPDPEGHVRTNVRVLFARVGIDHTSTPGAASNRAHGPGVYDQGPSSSCTGHALSGAIYTTLGAAGTPQDAPGSMDGIYKIGRSIDRHPGPDGERPELTDTGAMPNQCGRGLTEFGVEAMHQRPPDGRYSDVDPSFVNDELDLGRIEGASDFKLVGQYEIFPWDPHFVDLYRAAIAGGFCVCFAIFCDTVGPRSVEGWDPASGPLGAVATPGDPKGGGHYLYSDAYRSTASGGTIAMWPNSWGTGYGMDGFGEGDEAFMRGWSSVIVMKVKKIVVPQVPLPQAARIGARRAA